jgi:hypothetical protein
MKSLDAQTQYKEEEEEEEEEESKVFCHAHLCYVSELFYKHRSPRHGACPQIFMEETAFRYGG